MAATVAAADSRAQNAPSLVMKPTRYTGTVCSRTAVSVTARKNSFQAKITQIRAVAAMPGAIIGSITLVDSCHRLAPSTRDASSTSVGTSLMNERSIQTAIGRLIDVYRTTSVHTLSSIAMSRAMT